MAKRIWNTQLCHGAVVDLESDESGDENVVDAKRKRSAVVLPVVQLGTEPLPFGTEHVRVDCNGDLIRVFTCSGIGGLPSGTLAGTHLWALTKGLVLGDGS